jgi:2-oxo-4-hydroxy-4-carboxy--5-ureidoimidazoline (OHCU) decarboxylase
MKPVRKPSARSDIIMPSNLPTIIECKQNEETLRFALSLLLEPSTILNGLARELFADEDALIRVQTHSGLLDAVFARFDLLDNGQKAEFIGGHPRIGETKNLSAQSQSEQTSTAASAELIERLAKLNQLYEHRYPMLRYITFVNGRSRGQVADELEAVLNKEHILASDDPARVVEGDAWRGELQRALKEVALIAHSRIDRLNK